MKQVAEIYAELVNSGKVAAITRFNLRKFCHSFGLPPCGISFWELDDLNWDYLAVLNDALRHDRFVFRGGNFFPRSYLNDLVLGVGVRTEHIFLTSGHPQHQIWRSFFSNSFAEAERRFGTRPTGPKQDHSVLADVFRTSLVLDLVHFANHRDKLSSIADFYLALFFLSKLARPSGMTRDSIFEDFKAHHPQFRAQIMRIQTTIDLEERLDDILYLLGKLESD